MARPLRITYPGAFYHITSRGNERKAFFKSRAHRQKFLANEDDAKLARNLKLYFIYKSSGTPRDTKSRV